jgi:hypothetical protein
MKKGSYTANDNITALKVIYFILIIRLGGLLLPNLNAVDPHVFLL